MSTSPASWWSHMNHMHTESRESQLGEDCIVVLTQAAVEYSCVRQPHSTGLLETQNNTCVPGGR